MITRDTPLANAPTEQRRRSCRSLSLIRVSTHRLVHTLDISGKTKLGTIVPHVEVGFNNRKTGFLLEWPHKRTKTKARRVLRQLARSLTCTRKCVLRIGVVVVICTTSRRAVVSTAGSLVNVLPRLTGQRSSRSSALACVCARASSAHTCTIVCMPISTASKRVLHNNNNNNNRAHMRARQ